ncbi:hypothetical protein [Haloarchaeobius sp. DFWS5]|uniref:hypothetical protein n=1 Tax=Haloarchaeobius sp. DFWS5 TaxID=3446114 RepID=UPI003EBEB7C6
MYDSNEDRIHDLEQRVEELESIINRELGYSLGVSNITPDTVDCDCGEQFTVDLQNGVICPNCGQNANERGEA